MGATCSFAVPVVLWLVLAAVDSAVARADDVQARSNYQQLTAEVDRLLGGYTEEYLSSAEGQREAHIYHELLRLLESRADDLNIGLPPQGDQLEIRGFCVRNDGLGNYWAQWTYRLAGDYDCNGLVDLSDAGRLKCYYGSAAGGEQWQQAQYCDGNGDGMLDDLDLAAVADSFGIRIDYFRVVASYSLVEVPRAAGPPQAAALPVMGSVPLNHLGPGDPSSRQCRCELDLGALATYAPWALKHIWVEPRVELRGTISDAIPISELDGRLRSSRLSGPAPLEVRLSCPGADPTEDPVPTGCAWDLDGDGVYGGDQREAAGTTELNATITEPRCRLVSLQLSYPDGSRRTAVCPLGVYGVAPPETAQAEPGPGRNARGEFAKGDSGDFQLYFGGTEGEAAAEPGGVAVGRPQAADFVLGPAQAIIGGRPALAWIAGSYDGAASLYYAGALDTAGQEWPEPVVVSDRVAAEWHSGAPAMMELDGWPALAYAMLLPAADSGPADHALVFQRAADQAGLDWEEPAIITTLTAKEMDYATSGTGFAESLAQPAELKLIGGRPALLLNGANYMSTFYMVATALDPAGAAWQEPSYVAWSGPVGSAMSNRPSCVVREYFDWNGEPAFLLFHNSGGYYPQYSLSLCRDQGEKYVDTDLRQLPFDRPFPFFAELEDPEGGTTESISIALPPEPVPAGAPALALASLRSSAAGRLTLRAAYTVDGLQWRMTPEFDFSDSASGLAVQRCSIRCEPGETPDGFTAWLELRLAATLPGRTELWDTRIRLR